MRAVYDGRAKALYVYVDNEAWTGPPRKLKTRDMVIGSVMADYDGEDYDKLVGIEFIGVELVDDAALQVQERGDGRS